MPDKKYLDYLFICQDETIDLHFNGWHLAYLKMLLKTCSVFYHSEKPKYMHKVNIFFFYCQFQIEANQ